MKKQLDNQTSSEKADQGRYPWSKPELIDLSFSQTSTIKARIQTNEVAVFSSKAPTEEWGPS